MQVPTIEKSHSSPGSSKPSSEGQARSHGPPRCQGVGPEDAGVAIATAEAAAQQQQQHRLQPTRPGHRATDDSMTTASSVNSLGGNDCSLEGEGGANAVDSAIFQVPRIGKPLPNGSDKTRGPDALKPPVGIGDAEGKTQMMGEIKIALKKELKTEGEQLIVEILQCRNITYKFKTPDHLPDLYVKLYVVNVATQKRVIKKKTRVCRHDREPSFNETFRFAMNPAGHSIQLFLVSNGEVCEEDADRRGLHLAGQGGPAEAGGELAQAAGQLPADPPLGDWRREVAERSRGGAPQARPGS
ncbi:hypothetical protein ANANG_G00309250 [Anguilla anguilla]|uniref:C2 domain-containing protein n=1 Tax=Anguilla anguilla TaxID=7936 RepID=A0A9D3RHV0_ANGAN|nr:hypothetical protein ANANG_G00309250 [Anguilla anguilla]